MRRKCAGSAINTDGWMMSYADMATILLAMLIVLSTLSRDQTGITLYHGAGSFVQALGSFGLPATSAAVQRPILTNYSTPRYLFDPVKDAPDEDEEESLHRFLQELHRQFPVERLRPQNGQVVIDLYEPLHREPPYLAAHHTEALEQSSSALGALELPRESGGVDADAASIGLEPRRRSGAIAPPTSFSSPPICRRTPRPGSPRWRSPWRYRDIRRPILSLIVVKVEE